MATAVQIPAQITLEQYLHTTYHPDCEYIDGQIEERNVGKWPHSRIQTAIAGWFFAREKIWQVMAATEQRVQVSPTRIRIPDVVVVHIAEHPEILTDPPILVVEILSPKDTYTSTQQRATDYQKMGVETIWIVDPTTRTARVCRGTAWIEASRLEVPGTPIALDLSELLSLITAPNE